MKELTRHLCPWLVPGLETLETAVANDRLGHGWILAGPPGVGKLNLALNFAGRLLTGTTGQAPAEPAAPETVVAALNARYVAQDMHPDLHMLWPEEGKRTIGVDAVREVIERVSLTAYAGGRKIVIIEPAERMTVAAANALLKTLEEPAGGTVLLLVSHRTGRLPATIRSRCQVLRVQRPPAAAVERWLGAGPDAALLRGRQVGPVEAAQRRHIDNILKYNDIDEIIKLIYEARIDVLAATDRLRKLEPDLVLEWIDERIGDEIRARLRRSGWNSITEDRSDLTENRWPGLSVTQLFRIRDDLTDLRDRLDSGINETLALQVLLGGFANEASRGT